MNVAICGNHNGGFEMDTFRLVLSFLLLLCLLLLSSSSSLDEEQLVHAVDGGDSSSLSCLARFVGPPYSCFDPMPFSDSNCFLLLLLFYFFFLLVSSRLVSSSFFLLCCGGIQKENESHRKSEELCWCVEFMCM